MNNVTKIAPRIRHPDRLFIGGEWVAPSSDGVIGVVSPNSGCVVASVAEAREADMQLAVLAARKAFDQGPWPRLSPAERVGFLRAMAARLTEREAELAAAWTLQVGGLASRSPMMTAGGTARFTNYAKIGDTFAFESRVDSAVAKVAYVLHEPVGVVVAIAPWNAPYAIMVGKVAPALLAGCTVIMKPSPETPLDTYIMAEVAQEIGLPPGVLNLVPAHREASDWLVRHAGVDKVSFTGSTAAGRHIAEVCASRVARCSLELGGKSAAIVLDDYSIADAARLLAGTISVMCGQACTMLTRAIVPRHRHDELAAAIAAEMQALRIGYSDTPDTQLGPMATQRQLERVEAYIAIGIAEGAQLITGGKRPAHLEHGFFMEPTLFANVRNDMRIAQEEIFGPVLCLIPCEDEADAIRIANDSIYGLAGSVLTNDPRAALRVARQVRTGTIAQNGMRLDFVLPFGGYKQSGLGREGGEEGLLNYLETKTVLIDG